ncbi:hypothetical protein Rsub_09792 [Raphidocelis subcapitata]|uniref:ADP,ATP carrier protein n=1 Tax=Raphidocelis subcapitata TaxID=307507 RepID=A0A2V0PIX0_9CHLO|nr:hypothetical protein Rsub_09792 [Raphidocelis subcapitata]|eukprot:GBF96995.1 hypothetical protein Rsub_09792 [Raphidocelis subcapitata]
MLSLFFLLSYVNTLLDSLKDVLVITSSGGAAVLPFLSVYAVLPSSVLFLLAFSALSKRFSRATLFNVTIGGFCAFFAVFAFLLMPNAQQLHLHDLADSLQQVLPSGLAGGISMLRNWTYTAFFVVSELWGDVCMGLLFWGLANDTTALADAPTLYPLFGLGANIAQAAAGFSLKCTTAARSAAAGGGHFVQEVQITMAVVLAMAVAAICVHAHITATQPKPEHAADLPPRPGSRRAAAAAAAAAAEEGSGVGGGANGSSAPEAQSMLADRLASGAAASSSGGGGGAAAAPAEAAAAPPKKKRPLTLRESFAVLAGSVEIRCLALMSLAQGLCTSIMEYAWKSHIRLLYPSPSDFTSFLGEVAMMTGLTTAVLMLASPLLFERLGWRGVASATPQILLYGGSAFFLACFAYQWQFGAAAAAAAGAGAAVPAAGVPLLTGLVVAGALLYVFSKGAKFALFKPAEEMVYIGLDEEGRTRGKAAIDVVGSQTGKSGGSILQQALLVISGGASLGPILPVLFGFYLLMLRGWRGAVHDLSSRRRYTLNSPLQTRDEEGEEGAGLPPAPAPGNAVVIAPPRPAGTELAAAAAATPAEAAAVATPGAPAEAAADGARPAPGELVARLGPQQ